MKITDFGPMQPGSRYQDNDFGLKALALRFLHERCEGLGFDADIEAEEDKSGGYKGTSLAPGQIPYNMQMDLNRLCLERELEKFMDSAATQDAYTVFYCFLEIFFGNYGKYKKRVELLSEYESNGSSLLMKHRDHYVHSVYVFALGLAIYESNENFRSAFDSYYHFEQTEGRTNDDRARQNRNQESPSAAHFFLKYWGMTALFHDIGYPFELAFEQVMAFFDADDDDRTAKNPFIVYKNMKTMTELSPRAQARQSFPWICTRWPGCCFCATSCSAGTAPLMEEIPEKSCIPWPWNLISVKTVSLPDTCTTKRSRAK